jgi:hypothetical protein
VKEEEIGMESYHYAQSWPSLSWAHRLVQETAYHKALAAPRNRICCDAEAKMSVGESFLEEETFTLQIKDHDLRPALGKKNN